MNILDKEYRGVIHEGSFFNSYKSMAKIRPELVNKDWKMASFGSWLLDPHTGEAKSSYDWEMDWLEDVHDAWKDLCWSDIRKGILMPVVYDRMDPEGKTFISADMAMEMMKAQDPELMKELEQDPCIDATIQDVWEAFWAYQEAKANS